MRALAHSSLIVVSRPKSGEQTPWLDDKHVVFGEVIDGAKTVKNMELLGSTTGKPKKKARVLFNTIVIIFVIVLIIVLVEITCCQNSII